MVEICNASFDHSSLTVRSNNRTKLFRDSQRGTNLRRPRSGVTDNIDDDVDEDKEGIDDDDDDNEEPTKCRRRFFIFVSIDGSDNANTRLVYVYISIYA